MESDIRNRKKGRNRRQKRRRERGGKLTRRVAKREKAIKVRSAQTNEQRRENEGRSKRMTKG